MTSLIHYSYFALDWIKKKKSEEEREKKKKKPPWAMIG